MRLTAKRLVGIAVLGFSGFLANSSHAVPLSDLFEGESITVDDKVFSEWVLDRAHTQNGASIDLSAIDVSGLADDPLNPGLQYQAPPTALGIPAAPHEAFALLQLAFHFNVSTTSGLPLIKDNSLLIEGFVFDAGPGAAIDILEVISGPTGAPILGTKTVLAVPGDTPNSGNPFHSDSANFAPQSSILVRTAITIKATDVNDIAFLTSFEQRFSQLAVVPEPGTLALVGLALAGLGFSRRKLFTS